MFKRIAVGAIGLALPLTLIGAPAFASDKKDRDELRVEIVKVKVYNGKFKVDVEYVCGDEDDNDRRYKSKNHKNDSDEGDIKVTLTQKHAKYAGGADAECDGKRHDATITLDHKDGKLKSGRADVKAVLKFDDEKETDHETVRLYVKKHGR
ncbi:MAG TPA: hypothetical protein VF635_07605 [Propionibacteriaceae bacterium]